MPLRYDREIVSENGNYRGVVALCDACGERIGHADSGVLALRDDGRFDLAHKGVCHDFIEAVQVQQGSRGGWVDLRQLVEELARNHSDPPLYEIRVETVRSPGYFSGDGHPDFEEMMDRREARLAKIRERVDVAKARQRKPAA
jgi:hypothetical protein